MNIHVPREPRRWRFGQYDRITYKNTHYRYLGRENRKHLFQRLVGDLVDTHIVTLDDRQITEAWKLSTFSSSRAYFTQHEVRLRARFDTSVIDDLSDHQRMELYWRYHWVCAFLKLEGENGHYRRPKTGRSLTAIGRAIDCLREEVVGQVRSDLADILSGKNALQLPSEPSASTLYRWLRTFEDGGFMIGALRSRRENSGNRNQLRPEVRAMLLRQRDVYLDMRGPSKATIVRNVEDAIHLFNLANPENSLPTISERTVRQFLDSISPFEETAAREGPDKALRKFAIVGEGARVARLLERVEVDDWEFDLFALVCTPEERDQMSAEERKAAPKVRCTLTCAIDCLSRAIVGFNLSPHAPSVAGSIGAIRSIVSDKDFLRREAGCGRDWPMIGRPFEIVTDGGPAFGGDFVDITRRAQIQRCVPEKDPRKRPHIEAFFGTLGGEFVTNFSGRTGRNVLERGDYLSEENASLTFDELRFALIRWIVDFYHNQPHAGLGGRTPYGRWMQGLNGAHAPEIPDNPEEHRFTFSFGHTATIRSDGIQFDHLHYVSDDVAYLFRNSRSRTVQLRIDPEDLRTAFMIVPKEVRGHERFQGVEYVKVDCVGLKERGTQFTLAEWSTLRAGIREIADAEEKEGRPFRIAARADLYAGGLDAMVRANIPTHGFTQKDFDRLLKNLGQLERAALNNPADRKPDRAADEPFGTLVGRASATPLEGDAPARRRTAPTKPRTGKARPLQPRIDNDESEIGGE
ncbi:Mu transposase C-terminal domain-containing protein [Mangrovicella endophytica]|uniref:Mu transposase C-terminal domain-containing protein n=1 Tax=Mangrovicella endophytica TaxID=2066697 RepID=UPI000C9E4B63|nr:Mu transposase C-terminal domain-containing protein [Mangrovicella endophytica]